MSWDYNAEPLHGRFGPGTSELEALADRRTPDYTAALYLDRYIGIIYRIYRYIGPQTIAFGQL